MSVLPSALSLPRSPCTHLHSNASSASPRSSCWAWSSSTMPERSRSVLTGVREAPLPAPQNPPHQPPPCVQAQLCPTLCDPLDCSLPGSSIHGILQYCSGLPFPPPGDLPNPGIEPASLASPALACGFFTTSTSWEAPRTWEPSKT